jgi:type II secretory ATPase GspE/PulE/Tfp pilus assembly ATPase PilB-like protein
MDMGIEDYLLSSTLIGILAQRLVRVVCPHCREPYRPEEMFLKQVGIAPEEAGRVELMKAKGCSECGFTGYKGRTGIFEFLRVTDEVRQLILGKKDSQLIKEFARRKGMRTLREDGWLRVKEGRTTLQELMRVTQEEGML